jgi:hypothetical protein
MNQQKIAKYLKLCLAGTVGPALLMLFLFVGINIFGLTSRVMTDRFSCAMSVAPRFGGTFYTTPGVCGTLPIVDYILGIIFIVSSIGMLIALKIVSKKSSSPKS